MCDIINVEEKLFIEIQTTEYGDKRKKKGKAFELSENHILRHAYTLAHLKSPQHTYLMHTKSDTPYPI